MSHSAQAPNTGNSSISSRLLDFYDAFSEFNDICAFLCDAFTLVGTQEAELDACTAQGFKRSAQWLKDQMGHLKEELRDIQESTVEK